MKIYQPLEFYCDDKEMRFHILNVGEGLMVLILFPNSKVMLFDCNVTEENEGEILDYLDMNIPLSYNVKTQTYVKVIDIFVNSHRDEDHYRGLRKINERFPVKSIWDSGQTGATTQSTDYLYYMSLRRKLAADDSTNLRVVVPTDVPITTINGVEVFCFSAAADYQSGYDNGIAIYETATRIQHTNSIVLQFRYGNSSLLLTGDSDWKSWKFNIIPNFHDRVQSNILVASHHGSRSFFTSEENDKIDIQNNPDTTYIDSMVYIKPDITLIPCGDYSVYHHPNEDALEYYRQNTSNAQVYTTCEFGNFAGYINSSGNFTVAPARFIEESSSPSFGMRIECTYNNVGIINNTSLKIGGKLHFTVIPYGDIDKPDERVKVEWEVSNGGMWEHHSFQDIYSKDRNEFSGKYEFDRNLSYVGVHLLRCTLINRVKGKVTRIFVIRGHA